MALEYIKHSRPVIAHDMSKYGNLATHDIAVPCLLLYELGKIRDKNGTEVDIDKEFINFTKDITNAWIEKRHSSPFAKDINQWSKPLENVEAIPLIKNHKVDQVENQVGFSQGLLYTEEVNGILSLFTTVLVKDVEAKKDVENGLLRAISIGTRPEGSIKEISFVINEAAPLCGLMFSERTFFDKVLQKKAQMTIALPKSGLQLPEQLSSTIELTEQSTSDIKVLELAEEISGLQLSADELENRVIPNHIVLSRMIKTGKLYPWQYDGLIKDTETQTLELMERSMPGQELGIMFGTNKSPEKINTKELKLEEMIEKAQEKLGIKSKNKKPQSSESHTEMIRQNNDMKEIRDKELKHILELSEHSPDLAVKYIKYELGEAVDKPKYKDVLLSEYLEQLKSTKSKLSQLKQLQLGE